MSAIKKIGSFSLVNALVLLVASPSFAQSAASLTPDAVVAQRVRRDNDRIHYFGIGGTIGVSDDGDTELGDGGFSLVGRFSFNDTLAIHSASVLSGDSFASFALTNSFSDLGAGERVRVIPFVGAGIGVEIDDFEISPLVTAGVDVPISDLITGTARVNAAFNDGTDIGVVLGVGVDVLSLF
ncbi:hypothetical protein IQ260_17115 [Leptolyngbya cf. ectocarpi LEGE 11479]|uniref:Porin family protein n=1 Tax=Leptolyngbya cf. ectocarpi LEGE 11479 TaxID=1828722 RepID=A0A928ZVR7_LEPEC|nr:hypothetical protein [Leptolyngbya ectocarpi]MBE9068374.1 hypothetical protein [Leptolyngbya cf. ectocarpi LEGE 11479]